LTTLVILSEAKNLVFSEGWDPPLRSGWHKNSFARGSIDIEYSCHSERCWASWRISALHQGGFFAALRM